jgi:hypothetical protein
MSSRALPVAGRGHPRPVRPEWQLSPAEILAMLARPYFLKFTVERRPRRKLKPAPRRKAN